MSVRAKFFVYSITHNTSGGSVQLSAVCRGQENKEWAAATPSGSLTLGILNDAALAQFVPGREYFLDISPVPEA